MENVEHQARGMDILQRMMHPLCDQPEKFHILSVAAGNGTEFRIRAHQDDIGKLIGPGANTIRAIRTYMMVLGLKQGTRYTVTFEERQEFFYTHRN